MKQKATTRPANQKQQHKQFQSLKRSGQNLAPDCS